jgi:hypothetical protein
MSDAMVHSLYHCVRNCPLSEVYCTQDVSEVDSGPTFRRLVLIILTDIVIVSVSLVGTFGIEPRIF